MSDASSPFTDLSDTGSNVFLCPSRQGSPSPGLNSFVGGSHRPGLGATHEEQQGFSMQGVEYTVHLTPADQETSETVQAQGNPIQIPGISAAEISSTITEFPETQSNFQPFGKPSLGELHFQYLEAIRKLETVTIDLHEYSDLHGEEGNDEFQRAHVISYNDRVLKSIQKQHGNRELELYQAAVRLMRHSDFPERDQPMMSTQPPPWRQHSLWRAHMRALRFNQKLALERVRTSLFLLRYIGEEISSLRNDADPR